MAFQCASGNHFHINSELVFLEVLNRQGLPCAPGEVGRVVVTPLYGTAQPLIRYEQGDMATPGLPCSCGVKLPVLSKIDGRQDPILKLPGRLTTEMLVNKDLLTRTLKADALQVAQVAELQFEIRYVAPRAATPTGRGVITRHLRFVLHPELNVSYKKVAEIPRNAGGKQQRFVRELRLMSEARGKVLELLMESQYWPPETLLGYQRSQLSQLLHHARAQVPFYRERLDPVIEEGWRNRLATLA